MRLTQGQYNALLYIRNRELGIPDGSVHPHGYRNFLEATGFIEVCRKGFIDGDPDGFQNVVSFLGHVVMGAYEAEVDGKGKKKDRAEDDRA